MSGDEMDNWYSGPWIMGQVWHDLLFAHWPVPIETLRPLIPDQLHVDTYDGQAWLGVVPFRMSGVRPRAVPPLPWLSAFPELNVRTYVRPRDDRRGRPGVWFFSLDAGNPIAVAIARGAFHLPYFHASMSVVHEGEAVAYESTRMHHGARAPTLKAWYAPTGDVAFAQPGSLADWLTSRYCLYTMDHRAQLLRCDINHAPWPLQPAEARFDVNTMTVPYGIELHSVKPLLHFARRLEMVAWWPRRAEMLQ